jgi:diaminopimelate epimerase
MAMTLRFTKMQGAGNDFIVLDATRAPIAMPPERARALADRRFGIGADQILVVGPAPTPEVDFGYRIYNSSGEEVEHCGNGARCFLRYVLAKGLARSPNSRPHACPSMRLASCPATRGACSGGRSSSPPAWLRWRWRCCRWATPTP